MNKKAVTAILAVTILLMFVFSAAGTRLAKITPVKFVLTVQELVPQRPNFVEVFTTGYSTANDGDWLDKLIWAADASRAASTFPAEMTLYIFGVWLAVFSALPNLVEYETKGSD